MKTINLAVLSCALATAGCTTLTTGANNSAGRATVYEDTRSAGRVQGIGIESQDIVSMTDQMMRDMLANQNLVGRATPARVIVDGSAFKNNSNSRIDKDMITNRLRVELNRAANGRLVFVARQYAGLVEAERDLKRSGLTDRGTIRNTAGTAGVDFQLVGTISSLDSNDPSSATTSRYQQIVFEMLDMEYGTSVWSGIYEFKKSAQDDIIYR